MTSKEQTPRELRRQFIDTVYKTLDGVVSPTPYLEITEGANVDVTFLNGKAKLPKAGATEITVLDMDIGSLFFDDFNLLYEGVTGVGKTYTSDALFDTIFGPQGHYTLRLSGGILGSSALEPFTTTVLENGVPKTRIDHDKCKKYGALFIDEINRGDSQEVFQVVDGVIHVNGDTGYLGVPIPGTERTKSLAIIAAMNPADVQHSAATELDIAGENRFLKFRFPNGVGEAGASQLGKSYASSLHDRFWTEMEKKTGKKGGWRESYPVITDPTQLDLNLDGETREFLDVALGYVGYDPKETLARNAELIREGGIEPKLAIRDDNDYKKILEKQGTLKHGFVRRDLRKIRDLANLLAFIKGMKNGTYETKAGVNDVAASLGIVLESKTMTGTDYGGLITLVNDARANYAALRTSMNIPTGYGLRQAVWQAAMHAGNEYGFDAYINTIKGAAAKINTQSGKHAENTIRSRTLADLIVLEHFSQSNEADIKAALNEKGDAAFKAFETIYDAKKGQSSIYEHRLDSLLR